MKPDYQTFGKLVWQWVDKRGGDIFVHEDSEEIMEFAQRAGLAKRVKYDPAIHGDEIEAEPGSEIWYWGTGAE